MLKVEAEHSDLINIVLRRFQLEVVDYKFKWDSIMIKLKWIILSKLFESVMLILG